MIYLHSSTCGVAIRLLNTNVDNKFNAKDCKTNNLKVWSNKTKGPTQDSQNRLRHICLREKNLSFINNCIT